MRFVHLSPDAPALAPVLSAALPRVAEAGQAFLDMRLRIERQIEARTQMLSGVSHDLRTPLTRLRLGLSMLPPDEDVAAMERDVAEMGTQIDAFLAFMQGDAQESPAELGDPIAFVREIVEDAERAGQAVRLHVAETSAADETIQASFRPASLRRLRRPDRPPRENPSCHLNPERSRSPDRANALPAPWAG